MCLGNSAVWDKPIKSKKEAEALLDLMPLKLMLLMNCIYVECMNEYLKSVSEAKKPAEA